MTISRSRITRAAACALLAGTLSSCTSTFTKDQSSSYLIIDALLGASGAKPETFGGSLSSDVQTYVKKEQDGKQVLVPTIYADGGQVIFRLGLKDPGTSSSPTTPSTTNFITVTRYHVKYIRSDGRNVEGVDVPYAFDGAFTATVGAATTTASLTLVRIQAKEESPLRALIANGREAISTIAEVTFYGKDQAGHEVSVVGKISVDFADWGDPS